MDKIIIHLEVPAIEQGYDMYIPTFITVEELTGLLVRAVKDVSGIYNSSGSEVLCLKERGLLLEPDKTASDYSVQNGDHIVMI